MGRMDVVTSLLQWIVLILLWPINTMVTIGTWALWCLVVISVLVEMTIEGIIRLLCCRPRASKEELDEEPQGLLPPATSGCDSDSGLDCTSNSFADMPLFHHADPSSMSYQAKRAKYEANCNTDQGAQGFAQRSIQQQMQQIQHNVDHAWLYVKGVADRASSFRRRRAN